MIFSDFEQLKVAFNTAPDLDNNYYKINCLTHILDFYLGHLTNQKRSLKSRSELDPYPTLNGEWT